LSSTTEPRLVLTFRQSREIVEHAYAELPDEACGLLGGRESQVEEVYPLPNTEQSPARYLADPQAQLDAMLDMEARDQEVVGIYHSHPGRGAYPSPTDVAMAAYPNAVYLIVSLKDGKHPVMRAFHIKAGGIEEVDVVVPSQARGAA
jgi:proteasome lid subunit RPN8/RPN11